MSQPLQILQRFRDYHLRIGDALVTLAVVEGRSQIEVLRDVLRSQTEAERESSPLSHRRNS